MTTHNGEWRLLTARTEALKSWGVASRTYAVNLAAQVAAASTRDIEFVPCSSQPSAFAEVRRLTARLHRITDPRVPFVLSGIQACAAADVLPGRRFLVDLHGTLAEWLEYPPGAVGRWGALAYRAAQALETWALRRADGAITVTPDLAREAAGRGAKQAFVIPCGNSVTPTSGGNDALRMALAFDPEDIVFVFNGGASRWQMLPETIELFKHIHASWPRARLLFLTPERRRVTSLISEAGLNLDWCRIHETDPDEVIHALWACDVGLLLRGATRTNAVAFPNKFTEYISACLPTITAPGLPAVSRLVRQYGTGVVVDPHAVPSSSTLEALRSLVERRRSQEPEFLGRFRDLWHAHLDMRDLVRPLGAWVVDP